MSRIGNILLNKDVFEKKEVHDFQDAIEKIYSAGVLTQYGRLVVFGDGGERGTWDSFSNVEIIGIPFNHAMECLLWFTSIHNKALRNQGKTTEKKIFVLSRINLEITPFLKEMGIYEELETAKEIIKIHDEDQDFSSEWRDRGGVHNWPERTIRLQTRFSEKETEIFDSVSRSVLSQVSYHGSETHAFIADEIMMNAFIEGQRGLQLGSSDVSLLIENRSMVA